MTRYKFEAGRYHTLNMPVLLQIGSESPRDLYVTDALAAVLPNASIGVLQGQAHEGMTTAPGMYAEAVTTFLLGPPQVLAVTGRDRSKASTPGRGTQGVSDTNRTRTSHPPQNSL